MFCGEDVDRVAANAESAAHEVRVGAAVLHLDQLRDEPALVLPVALAKDEPHLGVALGLADTVDRRDRGDDDRVAALENGLGGGKTHLLDVLVDGRVLLDEEVACGDVGLGLVVVVVGDEVLDGVLREEVAHFSVGLRGERLVGRHDEGGTLSLAMTFAIVKVLPEPVTPSSVWNMTPSSSPSESASMAEG